MDELLGFLKFSVTYIVVCVGSILGFMTLYFAGVLFKERIMKKTEGKSNFLKKMERIENWFRKYGYKVILINRFLAGARSLVALTAGISEMDGRKVFLLALFSIIFWNGILAFCGYLLGENRGLLIEYITRYNYLVLFILIIFILAYSIYKYRNRIKWFA